MSYLSLSKHLGLASAIILFLTQPAHAEVASGLNAASARHTLYLGFLVAIASFAPGICRTLSITATADPRFTCSSALTTTNTS